MQFKRIISRCSRMATIVAVMVLSISYVNADTWKDPSTGYTWTYRVNGEESEVYNNGAASISPLPTGAVIIPSVLGDRPVTTIGTGAFKDCSSLTDVTIPDSVVIVGAFAFSDCSSLNSVVVGNGVTYFGKYAFLRCYNLKKVYISNLSAWCKMSFDYSGSDSPSSCNPLSYGSHLYINGQKVSNLVLPADVSRIESHVFEGSSISSVVIPDGIVSIEEEAFGSCESLKSVTIPDSVRDIGRCAFYGCQNLTDVTLPNGLTIISDGLFAYCRKLSTIEIPNGITNIGASAFAECSNLTTIVIPSGLVTLGDRAFDGCNLKSITIPETTTSVGRRAFGYCSELEAFVPLALKAMISRIGAVSSYDAVFASHAKVQYYFTVNFEDCFGDVPVTSKVVVVGRILGDLPTASSSEEMYEFKGWCVNIEDEEVVSSTMVVRETFPNVLHAKWKLRQYSMTFDANGGNNGEIMTQDYGTVLTAPTVTRTGYSFTGWSPAVPATVPAADTTYTARWRINQYTATFNANGGTGGGAVTQDYGSALVAPNVARVGYTFDSWSPEVPATVPATDTSYTAQWRINQYTATFDANGGTGGGAVTQDYGTRLSAPSATRHNYTFTGWSPEVPATVPAADTTYTAQWRINQYTMTFNANGGTGGGAVTQDYGSALVAPTVLRTGYTFTGWSPSVPATVPAADTTYTAQWRINQHTVTFDANGGTGGWSATRNYGSALTPPTVTRTGYAFAGWSPDVAATVPAEDVMYTAQWDPCTYAVSLDPYGGSLNGATESISVVFDSNYGELPAPFREFCNFAGWTLDGVPVTASTKVSTASNHTLVARWNRWGVKVAPGDTSSGRKLCELYPDDYANLTTVVIEDGITELPDGFFDGCDNVENLTLPESLETIGYDDLPTKIRESLDYSSDGFMVYQGWVLGYCDDLAANLVLPQGTIGIGTRALAKFWDLETVAIPDTVKHIGREAFFECTFLDDVTIPDSVETVAVGAFENCSYMQTLNIGIGVRKVADRAFARCTSLLAVAFADGLECVGACAFSNDWQMLSVSLPHSVTNVGTGAFAQCRRINGVSVPTNVKTMPDMFPAAYANIESVTMAAGETEIMESMFEGCIKLSGFTWAERVTNVGALAFFGCQSLESVSIPDSVVRIGVGAFSGCSELHDLTLSRSLVALPDYAFGNCGSLDSFIVPASVVSLGYGFISGSATTAVYYLGNAPQYDSGAYSGVPLSLVTYVVRGTRGWDGTPSSRVLPESWLGHDITYWTPNRFDATFDASGGYFGVSFVTTWSEQQITDMGYVLPNQNPVRPGYAFEGWWTERTAGAQVRYSTQVTATKAHTLYAHWRFLGNLVTTTFNANGGTVVVPGSQDYIAGQTYGEFPVPSRRGYVFLGWWTTANGGEHVTESTKVPSADIELFAHWAPIQYYVRYDANGGTGWMTNSVHVYDRQRALEGNRFSKSGHAFSGWARSADGQVEYENCAIVVNLAEVSNEVVTLYAVWSGAGYNVRFDSNGGTGVMENQTIQIGETQNLHTNLFAYSGREFLGWSETSSGAVAYKDGEAVCDLSKVNGDTIHLYAVWRVSDATWRVSFDANGGSVSPAHWNVAKNDNLDALPLPTRPGFTFEGWWTQRVGGSAVTPPIAIVSDMTVYAHWHDNDDQLPPVSDASGVAAIMSDSADLRLGENIKTVAEYNALVAWADENGIGHRAVRESLHAWTAYRMGAERLFEKAPTIEMGEMAVATSAALSSGGGQGAGRPTEVTVSVTVKDGDNAVVCAAEKVKEMFEVTTDLGDWSDTAKLEPTVTVIEGGDSSAGDSRHPMRFTVVPGDGTATRAFLRVKVK